MRGIQYWALILVFKWTYTGFCEIKPSDFPSMPSRFCSIPEIEKGLQNLSNSFDPSFDQDLARSSDWKKRVQKAESSNPPLPYYSLDREQQEFEIPKDVQRFESAIENSAIYLAKQEQSDVESIRKSIESMALPVAMKRLLEDVSLFFLLAEKQDSLLMFEKIRDRHLAIVTQASEDETVALQSRMLRLLSDWNPVQHNLVEDGLWIGAKTQYILECFSNDQLIRSPLAWRRCATAMGDIRKQMNKLNAIPESKLDLVEMGRIDEHGQFVSYSCAEKRANLTSCVSNYYTRLKLRMDSDSFQPVVSNSYETVFCYVRDLSAAGACLKKDDFIQFLDRIDFEISTRNCDMVGYWQRHDRRLGNSASSAASNMLGHNEVYFGNLEPYIPSQQLNEELSRYHLTAGAFLQSVSNVKAETNRLAYLLFTPKGSMKQPLLLFIPGSGEMGFDLSKQFRQRTIFEKVTSAEFQKKHPCFLLVISPPEDCPDLCGYGPDMQPGKYQRPFLSALSSIIQAQKSPAVDMDRIYATGLSMGGRSVYGLSFVAPHLFAACAPVSSGVFSPEDVREERPGNWWHLYNEGDYARHPDSIPRLAAFAERVRELGGDFRIGTYPEEGHNAWDAAWREDALWDWMFSKSLANERPASIGGARLTKTAKADRSLSGKVVCTASKAGFDAKRGPERAADGLDATAYVSAVPMGPGDWWLCEFKEPVTGRIRVQTGWLDGTKRLSRGHVEVSKDGKLWSRAAAVSGKSGEASFQQRDPIRFVKLLTEPRTPEVLTLRELRLE